MSNEDHRNLGDCLHCGRYLTSKIGYAKVAGGVVCHPHKPDGPDCYHLITVYGEEWGSRLPKSNDTDVEELRGKLEEMTRLRDNALRQLNREDDEAPFELEEAIFQGIDAVISDWEGNVPLERVISSIAAALHPDVVKLQERVDEAEAKVRELEAENVGLRELMEKGRAVHKNLVDELKADRAEQKRRLDDVAKEVFAVADAYRPSEKDTPDYIYSLGRCEGLSQARYAVLRGLGVFEPNQTPYVLVEHLNDLKLLRLAINDPGAFTAREQVNDEEYESLGNWAARAVQIALREGRGDR